jgi:hypothetical protein
MIMKVVKVPKIIKIYGIRGVCDCLIILLGEQH